MKRAAGCAALGALLLLCAATFAMRSMYIPGITFLVLGVGFAIWVTLATAGARLERESGPPTGGEVLDPLLKEPLRLRQMSKHRDGRRRVRVEIRFGRRGRRVIEGSRLV